jgi:predicted enzyme related to lactoylglutathione lyase
MGMTSKYVHTNLIATNWKELANFYINVFGCTPVPPERDLKGPEIDAATSINNAHITGMHLRLPGYGENGPTLEIFTYSPALDHLPPEINRPGFGHIAFLVEDVETAKKITLSNGGQMLGELVKVQVGNKYVTFCYLKDPESNIIELQSWS